MTVSKEKSELTRLDWSAQSGADPSQTRINPTAETVNHAQFALQIQGLSRFGHMMIDQCAKWLQHATDDDILGECRIRQLLFSQMDGARIMGQL